MMYVSTIVYNVKNCGELWRYTVVQRLSEPLFYVLHADMLRVGDQSNEEFLSNLTLERLVEFDSEAVRWSPSLSAAISSHDENFADWAVNP
jgi:hypothetical protein